MQESIALETSSLLLSAMYKSRGDDGLETRFLFGPPGAPLWNRSLGTGVFFRRKQLIRAALYFRQNGPHYLKTMAIGDIRSLLTKFITENYGYLANETFFQSFDCSYAEHVSAQTKATLAQALATSELFNLRDEITLYPLVPIQVEDDFESASFFLIKPLSLNPEKMGGVPLQRLVPDEYPPIKDWKGKREKPGAWLGVRSPVIQMSNKMKAAILGAVALTPQRKYRHQFSMRSMFGGRFTVGEDGFTTSYGEPHTPAMSTDIVLREADHTWLSVLASKLPSSDNEVRRQIRALEYFYRAWPLDASERFPWLFMALDAIYGDASRATQAVVEAMSLHGGTAFDYARIRLLLGLRNSVMHGGAPDVYDSEKYHRYYEDYGDDPISDLELITAQCLRSTIFGDALVEQPDPYADLIKAYHDGTLARPEK